MAKSIMSDIKMCLRCGSMQSLEQHHIFFGNANREISDVDGCWCYLCKRHHKAIHEPESFEDADYLQTLWTSTQLQWQKVNNKSSSDFAERYGKSYLEEDNAPMFVEFEIEGKPQAWQRFGVDFRKKLIYTQKETFEFEQKVKSFYFAENLPHFGDHALRAEMLFRFPMPKSWSSKKQLKMSGKPYLNKRGNDIDNLCKSVLDGLNGAAYNDDSQVWKMDVEKRYAFEPYVRIRLWRTEIDE